MRILGALAAAALVVGCGRSPAKEPAPAKLDVPRIAVPAPVREASDTLRRRWPFDERVRFAAYADVEDMMKMDLFRALAAAAPTPCVASLLADMRELAVGADERGFLVVARFRKPPEPALRECLAPLADDEEKKTLAIDADVAVFGDRDVAAAAMRGGAATWPAQLSLKGDALAAWTVRASEIEGHGRLYVSNERFRADATAEVPEPVAQLLENGLARGEALGPLSRALSFERKDGRVAIALELREPPVDQARDVGMLAALATHAVRAYLTRAKTAEAKATLGAIARAYVTEWETERDGTPRAKRKLRSYPPVPKTVPRGTAVVSAESDWTAWKDLHFIVVGTQRYQYEIVAAKDGESADIVARGDLDGDGKTSLFRVTLKVDRAKDALVVAPGILETDPDE